MCSTRIPDEPRALAFACHRADRLAEIGPGDKPPQDRGEHECTEKGDRLGQRDQCHAQVQHFEGIFGVDGSRGGCPQPQRKIVDDDREPKRHQQDVLVAAVAGRLDDEALQHVAECEEGRHQHEDGDVGIDAAESVEKERRIQRQHQKTAMREIDDVQNTVDQGQAERDEGVNRPHRHAVQNSGQQQAKVEHVSADAAVSMCGTTHGIGNTALADANSCG